jgi:hypothetical protein
MSSRVGKSAVNIAAWVFLAASISPLLMDLGWPPHRMSANQDNTYVLRAVVNGKEYTSWGLTYVGQTGHLLRLVEFAAVLIAAVLSLLPHDGPRRVGLVALVAWAGLWFGNALRMAIVAPIHVFYLAAAFTLLFFAVTALRASRSWTRTRSTPAAA